jgi:hypothetical protein
MTIDKTLLSVLKTMPDGNSGKARLFKIIDGSIESIKLSGLKLYVYSNGTYYE